MDALPFEVVAKLTGAAPSATVCKFKRPKRYLVAWLTRARQMFLATERPDEFKVKSTAVRAAEALAEEKGVRFLP